MDHLIDNRYRILDTLGAGGMAEVYLAHDDTLDRDVALKVMNPYYAGDKDSIERFKGEAKAAASLSHPNIVSIYDRGESEEGTYYIAMEHLSGGTLKEHILSHGPFSEGAAVGIATQIGAALQGAHRQGVIHRDIKPQNILVTESGEIKVTDFGIARAVAGSSTLTATGTVLGTVHYISPEQAMGESVRVGSDLYSLGVTLYEMITGVLPFEGDTTLGTAMRHVNAPLSPPREVNPEVAEGLNAVVVRLMSKYPGDRYPGAGELIRDLELVGEGYYPEAAYIEDTKASRSSQIAIPYRRRRRRRRAVVVGSLVGALALFGGTWASATQTEIQPQSTIATINAGISVEEGSPEAPQGPGPESGEASTTPIEGGKPQDRTQKEGPGPQEVSGGEATPREEPQADSPEELPTATPGKTRAPENPGSAGVQGAPAEVSAGESTDSSSAVATGEAAPISPAEGSEQPAPANVSGGWQVPVQEDSGSESGGSGGFNSDVQSGPSSPSGESAPPGFAGESEPLQERGTGGGTGDGGQDGSRSASEDGAVGAIPQGQNDRESATAGGGSSATSGTEEDSETSVSVSSRSSSVSQTESVSSPSGRQSPQETEQEQRPQEPEGNLLLL